MHIIKLMRGLTKLKYCIRGLCFKKAWLFPFGLLAFLSTLAAFYPISPPPASGGPIVSGDVAWMLTAAALVLLMTPGLSFFYGGMVSSRNVISTMLQSFVAMGLISILWVTVGFSLAFGDSIYGIIGDPRTHFLFNKMGTGTNTALAPTIPLVLFALYQLKFAIITPALITGSFAERVRFSSYMLFICLFSIFIYSPLAHWTWHPDGFLRQWGVLDFAGGSVVHMSAGFAALAGALALGRRTSFPQNGPCNIPFVLLGTGMLWFGWFGFNAGAALSANEVAAQAFMTTNTASASAMLAWLFYDGLKGRKPSALGACIGAVVGLVAITPAAGFVTVGASMFIGSSAAVISNIVAHWRSTRSRVDDTLDVFPCHGVGGIWGMLMTGVFADKVGLIYGETSTFLLHILAMFIVGSFTFIGSWILYKVTNMIIPLRVTMGQEQRGLDTTQHDESYSSLFITNV